MSNLKILFIGFVCLLIAYYFEFGQAWLIGIALAIFFSILGNLEKRRKPWKVVRTTFPYPEGYGVKNEITNTLIDCGLSYDQAIKSRDELNNKKNGNN